MRIVLIASTITSNLSPRIFRGCSHVPVRRGSQVRQWFGPLLGRVWIEDTGGNIVRFSGTYTTASGRDLYYHFDSWRTNVQPGLWLPTAVYAEETWPRSGSR